MYFIIRRKGNLFTKRDFQEIFGDEAFHKAITNNEIEVSPYNNYRGINNHDYRQWRRIPDLYHRSGIRKYINPNKPGPLSVRDAKQLGIDVAMATTSGYVLQRPEGLIYDNGQYRPKIDDYRSFNFSSKVIMRKGNIYGLKLFKRLEERIGEIPNDLYNAKDGKIYGMVEEPLSLVLTFENTTLRGIPYILLDQLYSGTYSTYNITEENIDDIIELIISGHVIVKEDLVYLDDVEPIKRHNFYNWVGKDIFCLCL